jgi:ABC-2 type transport system ATP-binding protein
MGLHAALLSRFHQPWAPWMTNSPVISVQDFHKFYRDTPAVRGISFEVAPGQITGVIGPNGAGKSTTMRALSGIIPATSGTLTVADFNVDTHPVEVKQRLAYVPDDPRLFPHLTVEDHLAFTAAAYRVSDAAEKALRLLQQFELDHKRRTAAKDLSRGMRQKLAICCAYLYDPVVLLFDEPLTGLDPKGIRTLKQSILDRAAAGAGILISSHLLAMVEDICQQILLLNHGSQLFCGSTTELHQQFGDCDHQTSLEQIFFAATGNQLPPAAADRESAKETACQPSC